MKRTLYVIIDSSGSMAEMGKALLQRNLCRFISQLSIVNEKKYADVDFLFFLWNSSVNALVLQNNGDIPEIKPKGSSELSVLLEMLKRNLINEQSINVLLLTDGGFLNSKLNKFKEELPLHSNLSIRPVAIGADADFFKLEKLSSDGNVYLPENISAIIESIFYGAKDSVIGPESVNQIHILQQQYIDGDWDA